MNFPEMELLMSHGCHCTDDQHMVIEAPIFQKSHDQREMTRCWWEYSKPRKKRRGPHQEHPLIFNTAVASFKDRDHHDHFNGLEKICLALLSTLWYHFFQAMIGVHEILMVEKEAALIMLSWGDNQETHKKRQQLQHQIC